MGGSQQQGGRHALGPVTNGIGLGAVVVLLGMRQVSSTGLGAVMILLGVQYMIGRQPGLQLNSSEGYCCRGCSCYT